MLIEITKGCAVGGARFSSGDRLESGKDVTDEQAKFLLAMGRAKPGQAKPAPRAKPKG